MRSFAGRFALATLLAGGAAASAEIVDRIAATVDDVAIAESEVRKAMALSALRPDPGESPAAFRSRVLDALIDQRLEYREALRFGPAMPAPGEIDAAMKRLRERLQQQGRDPAAEFAAAGMTAEEVRASLERQLVIQSFLQERFRPIAFPDEERARREYESLYVPQQRAAGATVEPFETVAEEMRRRSQQRVFDEEGEKWIKEIRQKARVAIYRIDLPPGGGRTPIPLSADTRPTPTAAASPAPAPRIPR